MNGVVTWWDGKRGKGRVKADAKCGGETFHFKRDWISPEAKGWVPQRGDRVAFDGEQTQAKGRQALRVKPA